MRFTSAFPQKDLSPKPVVYPTEYGVPGTLPSSILPCSISKLLRYNLTQTPPPSPPYEGGGEAITDQAAAVLRNTA